MTPSFSAMKSTEPPCIGFADAADPACKRCDAYDRCLKQLTGRRPPCYGTYDGSQAACIALCTMASTCAEVSKGGAKSKTVTKEPKSLESALNELQTEIEERLEDTAYDDMSRYALRKLCTERGITFIQSTKKSDLIKALQKADGRKAHPKKSGKKKVVIRRKK